MLHQKLPVLLAVLLLMARGSLAQGQSTPAQRPKPEPDYQEVNVPVPRAVSLVTDVVRVLLFRNEDTNKVQALIDRRRARSEKRDQSLSVSIPRTKLTKALGLVE